MQAHKQLQTFLQYSKVLINEKMRYPKLKVFTISKIKLLMKSKS